MNLSHSLYQLLTILLSPVFKAIVLLRAARGKEEKARLDERWGFSSLNKRPHSHVIWIHAVSVGEANSAMALVKLLIDLDPNATILMTTGTTTSAQLMADKLPKQAIHQYLPLDTPFAVKCFLDFWEPDLALWVESEIWPNFLMEIQRRQIPLLLMNGRMSQRSFQRWQKLPFFIKPLLKAFTWCGVQTANDHHYFTTLGASPVEVMPNLKTLTDPIPYNKGEYNKLTKILKNRTVWFATCTHPGEEEKLLQAHQELLKSKPNTLLFLAPRHVVRTDDLEKTILSEGFTVQRRSQHSQPDSRTQIYMIDSMGELGLFYKLSPMTFVGGTWVAKGGHNPIEAAQLGSYVFHGSSTIGNKVLYELLESGGLSEEVDSPNTLCERLLAGPPILETSWAQLQSSGQDDVKQILARYVKEEKEQAC